MLLTVLCTHAQHMEPVSVCLLYLFIIYIFFCSLQKAIEYDVTIPKILELCVDISNVIVLEGRLKFSVIEGRLRMPPAGMQRQCLRLGTAH